MLLTTTKWDKQARWSPLIYTSRYGLSNFPSLLPYLFACLLAYWCGLCVTYSLHWLFCTTAILGYNVPASLLSHMYPYSQSFFPNLFILILILHLLLFIVSPLIVEVRLFVLSMMPPFHHQIPHHPYLYCIRWAYQVPSSISQA